ncbi:hypothetical protein ACFLZ6_00985 [Nanoarchaeota archaeon]
MKRLIVILLCILLIGCAKSPSETVTGNFAKDIADQEINCNDCNDDDKCTTDICAGEEKKCIHVPIKRCCGDGNCEDGETCISCEQDCGKCYSLQDLQLDINKIYKRKSALAKNRVIGKINGEVLSEDYDFYDSVFITAILIKDQKDYLRSHNDFKEFIERIAKDRFGAFTADLEEDYPEGEYEYIANYSITETGTLTGEMLEFGYWAKIYQKFRSCAICNNDNESYETKKLVDPLLDGLVYIRCTPSLVIGIYSNQPQMLEKFWTNLDEDQYDAQITNWIDNEVRGAFDEAASLLDACTRTQ